MHMGTFITQFLPFIEDILHVMDQHFQVDILLLDFSKAFNTVYHTSAYYLNFPITALMVHYLNGSVTGLPKEHRK